ncbi:uncharacterized protein LOC114399998 [Glycine soja]|uniref:Uncharacterized protein n=1 Tax=Glycine max TaxID=3847 RepID=C6T2T5_SOYBN|nr:uncharacterized protein LOC114399998 [Glycine soja]XP_040868633.1 uncharacterized protein LOC121174137 [Glycine max]ACU15962.1 unknown [Glycine max]
MLAVHPSFSVFSLASINNKMSKEYCSTTNPDIVQDNISLALFDFPFCRDWTRGESAVPTGRSMIAVMQNPQLPLTRNYNFIHLHIDKIINPPE